VRGALLKNDHNKEAMASLAPSPLGLSATSLLIFNVRERKSERSARETSRRGGVEASEASQTKNRIKIQETSQRAMNSVSPLTCLRFTENLLAPSFPTQAVYLQEKMRCRSWSLASSSSPSSLAKGLLKKCNL